MRRTVLLSWSSGWHQQMNWDDLEKNPVRQEIRGKKGQISKPDFIFSFFFFVLYTNCKGFFQECIFLPYPVKMSLEVFWMFSNGWPTMKWHAHFLKIYRVGVNFQLGRCWSRNLWTNLKVNVFRVPNFSTNFSPMFFTIFCTDFSRIFPQFFYKFLHNFFY